MLFQLPGGDVVYAYGFMLGLAVVTGWNLAIYLAWRDGLDVPRVAWGCGIIAVLAIFGSRLLHVVVNPSEWSRPGGWLDLRGGIVAYGGFLGGTLGAYLAFGRTAAGFLRYADVLAPGVALGTALTRTGCFLNGCDFGIPAAVPWAVRFPRDRVAAGVRPGPSPAWQQHFETGASFRGESVGAASAWSLPVHPTQIYEAALGVVLFAVLLLVWRRKRFAGEVFLVLIIGYGLGRALIECFRGDALRGAVGPLSTSQVLGLATALAAALAAWKLRGRRAGAIG